MRLLEPAGTRLYRWEFVFSDPEGWECGSMGEGRVMDSRDKREGLSWSRQLLVMEGSSSERRRELGWPRARRRVSGLWHRIRRERI